MVALKRLHEFKESVVRAMALLINKVGYTFDKGVEIEEIVKTFITNVSLDTASESKIAMSDRLSLRCRRFWTPCPRRFIVS